MTKTKISILVSDVSNNCLGRCHLLAKLLEGHYAVEVIGPAFGNGIWEPLANDFPCKTLPGKFFPGFIPEIGKYLNNIRGDIIYALKPLFTSFAIGVMKKYLTGRPLVLDIDDSEKDLALLFHGRRNFLYPNSYLSTITNERLTFLANGLTVAGRGLQKEFGGTIVWHGRDTSSFSPEKYNGAKVRQELGIRKDRKVVTFMGSPRPYKGLEDLVRALGIVSDKRLMFLVVGLGRCEFSRKVRDLMDRTIGKDRIIDLGLKPFRELPRLLSVADIVVIPQRISPETRLQVPAKVFDAMAMAKPIIATRVSDLPEILDGCGYLTDPGNTQKLAEVIERVIEAPDEAEAMGRKARAKCIEKYSWNALEATLVSIFSAYL